MKKKEKNIHLEVERNSSLPLIHSSIPLIHYGIPASCPQFLFSIVLAPFYIK